MPAAKVIAFTENNPLKTNEDGLGFIRDMRRKLDRFDVAFPGAEGKCFPPEEEQEIRRLCDGVEANIRARMASI